MSLAADQDIAGQIADFIRRRFPAAGDDLDSATPLLDGTLDSLGVLELMVFLGETYDVEIGDGDFAPENFETITHLAALVERKRSA